MLSTISYVAKQGVLLARLSLTLYFYLGFGAQTQHLLYGLCCCDPDPINSRHAD